MPHNFFPVLLAILLIAFPVTVCGQEDERFVKCGAEYECGGKKMSYPFWGGDRSNYCGHPGFELYNCDGDAPEFTMEGVSYRVLDINNSTNTLTVARADYWDDSCPYVYVNTTLNTTLYSYNTTTYTDVSIYHNCQNVYAVSNQFNCTHRNNYTITFCYFTVLDLDLGGRSIGSCDAVVSVPVFESAAKAIVSSGGSIGRLREALRAGFGLVWNASNSLCRQCIASGGYCGYDSRPSRFLCYCRDGPSASATCDNVKSPPPPPGSNLRRKIIIGTLAGVGGLILVLAIFGCHRITKCWLAKESEDDENVKAFISNYGSLASKRYTYSDIKRMTDSFTSKLGQGGFGCVYEGKLSDGRMVAVKLLNKSEGNGQDFINEVASISTTSHVNIVTLLGFCFDRRRRALVYEFMPNGSLDKFIFNNRRGSSNQNLNLEWTTLHQIAVGIARGLEYLYRGCNTRILHFDIKPHNILLDQNFVPKISDFGLAKLCQTRDKSTVSMTQKRGTPGYIAPEVFCRNFGGVSHKSDVYSYGMLVLEMVGGRKNFDLQVSQLSQIDFPTWIYKQLQLAAGDQDLRVLDSIISNEEEEEIARKMALVSLWCIQPSPSDRPSIDKVVEMLEGTCSHLLYIPPCPFMSSDHNSP